MASLLLASCAYEERTDWDNPGDPRGLNYHPPTVVLSDTAYRNPDFGQLIANATGENSTIKEYAWTVDGEPTTRACAHW